MSFSTFTGSRLISRYFLFVLSLSTLCGLADALATAADPRSKLLELTVVPAAADSDWLVKPTARKAGVYRTERPGELVLDNGLVRRTFLIEPNLACVELRQLQNGESLLRSIRPECRVRINDQNFDVGGLVGQPLGNFLRPDWYPRLKNDPASFQFTDFSVRPIETRFAWKQRPTWMANDVVWPPQGVEVQFRFAEPLQANANRERTTILEERFESLSEAWKVATSDLHPRTSFQNEGKVGEVFALENSFAFAEREWLDGADGVECEIDPGTDQSASWGPGLAIVGTRGIVRLNLRPGKAEFGILQNDQERTLSGMTPDTPVRLRLVRSEDGQSIQMWARCQGEAWRDLGAVSSPGVLKSVRVGKMSRNGKADDFSNQSSEPASEPKRCRISQFAFLGKPSETNQSPVSGVEVVVHYEMYDGLPLMCKWFTLHNQTGQPIHVDAFTSEILACVEASSQVEDLAAPLSPNLHIETDFTSCSMHGASAQRDSVHWMADPTYKTQVNYLLQSKCLLECRPPLGPDVDVADGETLESFRTWILAYDDRNETRQALALGRMYKTISPWVTENPLIHHVRSARPDAVRLAIDQSAAVGFELVIMTFGSGFDIENEDPAYLSQIRELADYAHGKGIALGGYSLLASRSVSANDDVINPETGKPGGFARFGNSPCLESEWGQDYFRKLYNFYEATGCDLLEHDGSYPGDACASPDHPGHAGYQDSRWRQWQTITAFYRWCRGRGVYLNVPDWYYLNGSNKSGMGYRETNWSLPRDYQEIIERQNIHDGTRFKLPTMGWMFVPLTQYHGGGAEATIEPLSEHLDHYERRLQNLLGAGVQACFRGPRIYDTEETKSMVKHWVDFYKQHRSILDSALIPLRRADGRDWDGWLHVHPELETPALAVVYNPLNEPITRDITIPLYYSGLSESTTASVVGGDQQTIPLDRRENAKMTVTIAAQGATWIRFSK
jgi:hypothetical protein